MTRTERLPISDRELFQPALVLAQQFVQRWDMYAQQLDDGRYICVRAMLNVGHLFMHLRGEVTLGAYLLDQHSRARFIVYDADDQAGFENLGHLAGRLAGEEVPSYLEKSRRGGHLWLFLEKATKGKEARAFGLGVLAAHQVEDVELYPKQDRLSGGPGSLIRMPFGVHRLSGQRYGFYTPDGEPLAPTLREQIYALGALRTVPEAVFTFYNTFPLSEGVKRPPGRRGEPTEMVSERIKASVTVMEFVSQYVELKPTKSGAVGLCPFHEDDHASFGVNEEGNYWNCFAGCGGGSVIDFYMKLKGCDFTTAVKDLAETVL